MSALAAFGSTLSSVNLVFGPFTLDVATRRLLHDQREIHLSPKAFELLRLLAEERERAISKDELHRAIWPSTHVVESNLAGLVVELRRALGDRANRPVWIRTVPRFGYRFVGPAQDEHEGRPMSVATGTGWLVWDTRQIALHHGMNVVGRGCDAAVWIDAAGVSRHHACIRLGDGTATIEDLGSKNGTFLGGRRVSETAILHDGDQIRLGSVVVAFRLPVDSVTETEARL